MHADVFKVGLLLLVVSVVIMSFVSKLKKMFAKNKKKFLLYILVVLVLFGATGFLSNKNVLNNLPLYNFISFQIIFLLLGLLHFLALRKFFSDLSEEPTMFWAEALYTIVTLCFGVFAFMYVVTMYKPDYTYAFIAATLPFLIPLLVVKLFEFATSIPVPVYQPWYFPSGKISDPKGEELENPLVISFEFNKGNDHEEVSNFRLKAPERMEFGKLFYFFINDYNERHPNGKIKYLEDDKKGEPCGWIFYTRPNWYGKQKYINYNKTIQGNNIEEDDIIICKRVPYQKNTV